MDDKSKFYDVEGRPVTQSLFLEIGYNTDYAIYTFKHRDHEYKGKTYKSIRNLYLECEDPTEYEFANKYFIGWAHWKRCSENKLVKREAEEWREELELSLRCKGIRSVMSSAEKGGFQSAKWLVNKGWDVRTAGRPSKEEVEREKKFQARAKDEFSADILRLKSV